jgi:NAD dependent epimerase/dehydratase
MELVKMNLDKKNVFVTGAGGFIGSHLCSHLLENGANVTAMLHYNSRSDWSNLEFLDKNERDSLEIVKGNVEDSSFMNSKTKDHDVVFHLAALIGIPYSYEAPLSYVKTNIEGTVNVLEAARRNDIELVINTSTSETYGSAIYTPIDELHPLQGQSPYSASKISADKLAESYFNSFDLPVITVRPFNTFGPRQSSRAVIPTIISQLLTEKEVSLGDTSPVRDFTYVDDTANGFICAANNDNNHGEFINLGYGKAASIGETAELIMDIMNINKEITSQNSRIRPKNSEVIHLISDNKKAADLIKWEPQISFREGLEKTIKFVETNIDLFKTDTYSI